VAVERPNLDQLDPAVRAYVEALEAELERLRQGKDQPRQSAVSDSAPAEPPTTLNVITVSAAGMIKRTPRHLYPRQHRGGMGIFDLETPEDDPPAFLTVADESQAVVAITNLARAFRLSVRELPESPVHSRGQSLAARLHLPPEERLCVVLPDRGGAYVALLSRSGHVLWFAGHLLGERLQAGLILYETAKLGAPAAACWSAGNDDLFIATRRGLAIRFASRLVPTRGCLGIRLERDDVAVAIAAVQAGSGVFMLGADGQGTLRLMSGFNPNKAPGGGGKIALKTDHLVGATTVGETDDLFIVSRLGKLIRFQASEVPAKQGVVQGVACMALRADECMAFAASPLAGG
jgi:DNA gyrase subunit A